MLKRAVLNKGRWLNFYSTLNKNKADIRKMLNKTYGRRWCTKIKEKISNNKLNSNEYGTSIKKLKIGTTFSDVLNRELKCDANMWIWVVSILREINVKYKYVKKYR